MRQATLLRNLIPATIVAVVLASSFVISAGAKDHNGDGGGDKCGYGYGQSDNDEGDHHEGGDTSVSAAQADKNNDKHDNDKCEDENDEGGGDNGGGGGDNGGGGNGGGGDQGGRGDHIATPAPPASKT